MMLMVALIVLNFAGIFCFGSSLDCKMEEGLFMIDWLFYQQYRLANACSQRRSETRNVFAMVVSIMAAF